MKRLVLTCLPVLLAFYAFSQTVPFPPNPGNTGQLENWGYDDVGTNWDTSPFLPFIYNGIDFRLMPPNGVTYTASTKTWNFSEPGKKYPLILFFNGAGEDGHDNNNQLRHGAKDHKEAVLSGEFPGFLFYPQSVTHDQAKNIIEKLIQVLPIDYNRIYVHGLSKGGGLTWQFLISYPNLVAGAFPMSAANDAAKTQNLLYNPIRQVQGGKDTNPAPQWTQTIVDWFNTNGGHLEYFYLPETGHGTWTAMYARPDFFTWFLQQRKNKILVRYDRNELCPEAPISVDMGFTPGFEAYEWYRNGQRIQGANSHKLIATQYGEYYGRIRNRGVWFDSDTVVVKTKAATNTPPIQVNGVRSIVLPAADGASSTELMLPEGYQSYTWRNSNNQVIGSSRILTGATVGSYTATAMEVNGCATIPSPAFQVVNANGPNKPEAISNFIGYAVSESSILLSWTDKPSPTFNETGLEIYRSTNASQGYKLVSIAPADAIQFTDTNLTPNTTYYYKIRPVNQYSAGPLSEVIAVLTEVDNIPPTAPGDVRITSIAQSSVSLDWSESSDNVGVYRYDIFRDGVRVLSTSATEATVYNLTEGQFYKFEVKARDVTGNVSPQSTLVTAKAAKQAFEYRYYEASTFGPNLPNFNNLTPVQTGYTNELDLSVRRRDTNFAMMWIGSIYIPVAGTYTFITNSDDGSNLYIGSYSSSNLVVNNDGSHGSRDRTGNKTFSQAGNYPIIVTYYQGTGGLSMQPIYWQNTAHGTVSKTVIPLSQFLPGQTAPGTIPQPPQTVTATTASYNQINLSWTDNSNNETGFRIYRSESNSGPFVPVGTTAANTTTFQDKQLNPSTKYYYRVSAFGNNGESGFSNQVPRGFTYSYYEAPSMTSLSQISTMTPKVVGTTAFFDVNLRERNQNFALKWVGKIYISTAATYTFYTSSDDGSTLHIDNVQVVSNDFNQTLRERSGTRSLTVGWHDIEVRWRKRTSSSSRLTVAYSRSGMSKTTINQTQAANLFFGTEVNATTLPLPAAPATATNVTIAKPSNTSFLISWQDNATDETNYKVLRSYMQNNNFVQYKVLPAGTTSFADEDLFANATYFYKIQAVGPGGTSTSAEVSGTTSNNPPSITALQDLTLKFGKTVDIDVYVEDLDNDPITLNMPSLPPFATFTDHGDGTGNLHLAPQQSQLGNYTLSLNAADNHGGLSTEDFVFTVTDKDVPQISNIPDVTVSEAQVTNFLISATSDFGVENLTWSFSGLPEFATYQVTNGLCQIFLSPQYIHSGQYTVSVKVTDPLLVSSTKAFLITVGDVNPNQKVLVNIVHNSNGPSPWNNVTGRLSSGFLDESGTSTGIGLEFMTTAWNTHYEGAVTGNNSGVFPDNVLRDYYYFGIFGAPETVDLKISGLVPTRSYKFSFLGSSVWTGAPDNGSTLYTINGTTVSLWVQNNTRNLAVLSGITPNPDGTVTVTMRKATGTSVGYLNALTIESIYQDGTAPAAPRAVEAALEDNHIRVSWVDAPFNETGFNIYKASSESGPFTKINTSPIPANSTSYVDNSVQDGATYYYRLVSFNSVGQSAFSNTASVSLPDLAPQITVTGDLEVSPGAFGMISVSTADDATLTVENLPSFAFLSPVGPSATDIVLLPSGTDAGTYTFNVSAVDAGGHTATRSVVVTVTESVLYRILVNFTQQTTAPAPWNNTSKAPAANDTFSNLRNDSNALSGVNLTLVTAFGGVHNEGASTGNNSGAVPDNVLREYYWFGVFNAPNTVTMRVSGLNTGNKYRFKFISSSNFTNNGTITNNGSTVFTIGTKSASVNVQGNTSNFAIIEDVITNAQGQVTIVASKGPNAPAGYLNGLIIEALPVDPSEFAPSDLAASGYSKTQVSLRWSDNSPVETGYQVYRSSTGVESSYALIATLPADQNTYLDNVPSQNTLYHYRVRATTAQGPSPYTNVARSSAVAFKVLVNVAGSATYDAPVPWNNLSRFGFENDVFVGFKDENGLPTGLRLRVQTPLEGDNDWGMNTGNNSGIFPDKVLQSFWFNDAFFPQGEFLVEGLDQTFSYNFGFMGAIDVTNAINTDFTINGVTVTNRNDRNISNVSYIRNVKPDSNSEVLFTVKESAGSPWSIFNAFVIEGFATGGDDSALGRKRTPAIKDGNFKEVRFGEASNLFTFYPNPVRTEMNVRINDASFGQIKYEFYDLMGRLVQEGVVGNELLDSEFVIDVNLPNAMYLMKVTYPDGKFDVRKFMKE